MGFEQQYLQSCIGKDNMLSIDSHVFVKNEIGISGSLNFLDLEIDYIKQIITDSEKSYNIIKCCIFSAIVYKYKESQWVYDFCSSIGITDYIINQTSTGLVYGIFLVKDCGIFLTFKGSSSFNDFLTNINLKLVETKEFTGKVHQGFAKLLITDECYFKIYNTLQEFINKYKENSGTTLFITGHSLGGALSTLFYSLCKNKKLVVDKNLEHFSFGAPRIGDSTFSNSITTNRIVNDRDIVSTIPFTFPIPYRHTETQYNIGKSGSLCKRFSMDNHYAEKYYYSLKF